MLAHPPSLSTTELDSYFSSAASVTVGPDSAGLTTCEVVGGPVVGVAGYGGTTAGAELNTHLTPVQVSPAGSERDGAGNSQSHVVRRAADRRPNDVRPGPFHTDP